METRAVWTDFDPKWFAWVKTQPIAKAAWLHVLYISVAQSAHIAELWKASKKPKKLKHTRKYGSYVSEARSGVEELAPRLPVLDSVVKPNCRQPATIHCQTFTKDQSQFHFNRSTKPLHGQVSLLTTVVSWRAGIIAIQAYLSFITHKWTALRIMG